MTSVHATVENVSRRGFLQGLFATGGLVVAAEFVPSAAVFAAYATGAAKMAGGVVSDPHVFVSIDPSGLVTIVAHRAEMGTGARTSLPMVVADELEADWSRVKVAQSPGDEKKYGNQNTDGSRSMRHFIQPMRECGAAMRQMLETAAAQRWSVPVGEVQAQNHEVIHKPSGRKLGYGDLAAAASALPTPPADQIKLKDEASFRYLGKGNVPIVDLFDITTGRAVYGIDARPPGVKIATLAQSPVFGGRLKSVDDTAAKAVKGVRQIVRLDDAVAVMADHMGAAKKGLAALVIEWDDGPHAKLNTQDIVGELEKATLNSGPVAQHIGNSDEAMARAVTKVEATYQVPFLAHATMEPMNCTVHVHRDGCEVWVGTQVTARVLDQAPDLVAIGAFCIGVNQIDLAAASRRGVAVFNAPFSNTRSVVELALAEIIALARRLPEKNTKMHAGHWDKSAAGSHEVRGRKLGIVGYGNIGTQLSVLAENLGMSVYFYDVADKLALGNARRCSTLTELLESVETVTLHVDGRDGNRGFFGEAEFAAMRPRSLFLNLSRGFVVDHAALRRNLQSGHIAGSAIDVFPEEPKGAGDEFVSELRGLPNVILTPHIGGSTHEAQEAVGVQIARQVKEYLKHGVIQNAVNVPSVSADEYAVMQPYIILAERMGAFLAQVSEGSLEEISIRYSGHIAEWKTELIRNGAIKGIMNQALEEKANLVNAATIADERGLRVLESHKAKASTGGAGSVLSIFLKTSTEEHMVKGAVLHGEAPRLLHVDGIDVEAPLERNLIYMRNRDVPGVIGRIGTILGEHGVNIANFALGRDRSGARPVHALAVVQVDPPVPAPVLESLLAIEALLEVKLVRLSNFGI